MILHYYSTCCNWEFYYNLVFMYNVSSASDLCLTCLVVGDGAADMGVHNSKTVSRSFLCPISYSDPPTVGLAHVWPTFPVDHDGTSRLSEDSKEPAREETC